MHKDVTRSLLLWPAAASITITGAMWFPTQFRVDQISPRGSLASLIPAARIQLLETASDAVADRVEMIARSEHGNRAMRLPPRVAEAFGVTHHVIRAPVVREQQELAGLVLNPPQVFEPTVEQLAKKILQGDLTAADQIASGPSPLDRLRGAGTVQSLRDRMALIPSSSRSVGSKSHSLMSQPDPAQQDPGPQEVGLAESETWELGAPDLNPPEVMSASLLPRSNRALGRRQLGRRELVQPDLGEIQKNAMSIDSDPSQTVFPIVIDRPELDRTEPLVEQGKLDNHPRGVESSSPAGWPVTTRLDEQLDTLTAMAMNARPAARDQLVSLSKSHERITDWTEDVTSRLQALRSLPRLGDERAGVLIDELGALASEGGRRAEQIDDRAQQIQWLGTAYAVARRVEVWRLVWEVTRGGNAWMVGDQPKQAPLAVAEVLANVRNDLDQTGDVEGWTRYLSLDEIGRAPREVGSQDRMILAQRVLSRLHWHRLSREQQLWLQRESISELAELVRPWAQDAVDYANLMHQIELQESDAFDLAAIDVAGAVQTLRCTDNPLTKQIAEKIDTHYRNANLRIALSESLLMRVMPEIETKSIPVNSTILGSRVRGTSRVETDLAIQLVPSPDRWALRLNSLGNVTTLSTGVQNSVAIRTLGQSQFQSGTAIDITASGASVNGTEVDVRGNTRLRDIDTDYDGWPLIGPLVRTIAENRYRSVAPQANQIASRTMQHRIESEIDQMLETRVNQATEQLSQLVIGPLSRLQLDPKVTDLQTTDQRLIARFRLAGDWQMAAFTPRPRAPGSSLMSVQLHQSALNNTLEQLVPRGESVTIRDLFADITETFGQGDDVAIPDDLPDDVTIQFSRTRPVTVELDEDRLWITLRIVRLRRAESLDLTQFIVRAAYQPQIDGMKASLVRDGHLRISGPRMSMRERLPARTIFNKVFSTNREIPVTLPRLREHPAVEGLAISQLELRNGWLAVAVSESEAPRIALAP